MRTIITAIALTLSLASCGTPAVVAINQKLPEDLLKDCDYASPPEANRYKAANWSEKEKMWTDTYSQSVLYTSECNSRHKQLRKLNSEQ